MMRSSKVHAAVIGAALLGAAIVATNVAQQGTKNAVAAVALYIPDASLTPGMVDPRLTDDVLLAPGFATGKYRPSTEVTDKIKVQAFALYGIPNTPANMAAF